MVCGLMHCQMPTETAVVVHVVDREYLVPRCPWHRSKNDSFVVVKSRGRKA